MEVAATSHLAYKTTSSVKIVISHSPSNSTARNSTTIAGETSSIHGPSVSGSGSSWVAQSARSGILQLSSPNGPSFPVQATRLANTSQALKSFSKLLSRSSLLAFGCA